MQSSIAIQDNQKDFTSHDICGRGNQKMRKTLPVLRKKRRNEVPRPHKHTPTKAIMSRAQPSHSMLNVSLIAQHSGPWWLWNEFKEVSGQRVFLYRPIYDHFLNNISFARTDSFSAAHLSLWRRIRLCWKNQDSKMKRYTARMSKRGRRSVIAQKWSSFSVSNYF